MATTDETREDIPLKKDGKRKGLKLCSEDFLGGSKFINISLAVITIAITIALFFQISYGDYQIVPHGSVATDSKECSIIGTEVMKRSGNAVDATIASVFCLCVVSPHVISLDGQGEAIIYDHREQLPPVVISFNKNAASVSTVPNLVAGLSFLYLHYGKMNWKDLIEPSISLARNGFKISSNLATAMRFLEAEKLFGPLKENNELKLKVLANTLEKFSSLTNDELRNLIPHQNQPEITTTANMTFEYYNIFVPGGISEGSVLLHTLKRFNQANLTDSNSTIESEFIPKIAKINKMVYDELNMSDTFFEGTSTNVAVIDDNDLYVSFVGGLHAHFGNRIFSNGGYLLDIKTELQPPSRFPILILDKDYICGRRIMFGAFNFVVASEIVSHLLINSENVTTSVEAPRFYIRPDNLFGTEDMRSKTFNSATIRNLEITAGNVTPLHKPYPSCNIVEKNGDTLVSHSDSRGGGISSRF